MNQLSTPWPDASTLVKLLEPLQALAIAIVDDDGRLLEANRGFRRLVSDADENHDVDAHSFLALPTFETVRSASASGAEDTVYRGRITVCHRNGDTATLRGEIRRLGSGYLLAAEHDVEQLESVTAALIELNEQMAESQRELVHAKKQLEARERELERMAAIDPLTGLANRRELDLRLKEAVARSRRTHLPLSVVMIDLDGFKAFNDANGHQAGDACLVTVATILAERTRPYDVVSRYGGEEFALVLIDTDAAEAYVRCDGLREAIEAAPMPGTNQRITASFGIADHHDAAPQDLLEAADRALYEAKRAGRNRVHVAGEPVDDALNGTARTP